jgi:5-dehydro-2-deoxygluconokinase
LITASTLSHIMQRFYDLGIYPDWWQFASPRDQRSWDSVARTIEDNDPDCLGTFIQLPAASMDHLNVVVEQVAKQSICKGIVIGRHIVQPVLEQWLSQKIADHILIEQVKPHFQQIVNLWTSKKSSRMQEESVS